MEELVLNILDGYYAKIKSVGNASDKQLTNLYLLTFVKNFLLDYEGNVSEEDYSNILNLIECLTNNMCEFSYADFLKYKESMCEVSRPVKSFHTAEKYDKLLPIYEQLSKINKVIDDINNTDIVKSDYSINFEYE